MKPIKQYVRLPTCTRCGGKTYYKVKQREGPTCSCGGYEFKHRKGSKYCYHHPDIDKHMEERYANSE